MITIAEIKEWFENNKYKDQIALAKKIQLQNQVYTIPFNCLKDGNEEYKNILKRAELKIGNNRTYSTFKANISYPLEVNKFVKSKLFNSLSKVWQGRGGFINRYPKDQDASHVPSINFYKNNYWERYITHPNDLLALTINDKKEIEYDFVDFMDVEYLNFVKHNGSYELTEIVYKETDDIYIFSTLEEWGKFEKKGSYIKFLQGYPKKHNFNFNHCTFLSSELYNEHPVVRMNEITESLGELEDLFFATVARCVVDKNALPYTIIAGKKGCNYDDGTQFCNDGYLAIRSTIDGGEPKSITLTDEKGALKRCPKCGSNNLGYGGIVEVNTKNIGADDTAKLIQNAVNFAYLDVEALRYPSERKNEIQLSIYNDIVGVSETFNPNQQQNETRIMSAYEDKLSVIFSTKKNLETFMSTVDTKAMIMKHSSFKESLYNLGNKFYLLNESEYQELIKLGNETRLEGYIDNKLGLIEVTFKNDKNRRDREVLIYTLEKSFVKFPNLTNDQMINLYSSNKISDKDFFIAQNFRTIIEEIEVQDEESRTIDEITQEMDYREKYNFINDKISTKWQEQQANQPISQ